MNCLVCNQPFKLAEHVIEVIRWEGGPPAPRAQIGLAHLACAGDTPSLEVGQ